MMVMMIPTQLSVLGFVKLMSDTGLMNSFIPLTVPAIAPLIMKPAIAVQAIFIFVSSWNNFFIPALLLNKDSKKTMQILISQLRSADFLKFDMGLVYMLIAVAILPVIVVYLIFSKNIVGGITLGSVKG